MARAVEATTVQGAADYSPLSQANGTSSLAADQEKRFQELLKEMVNSKDKKCVSAALQIDALQGVNIGDKLFIMHCWETANTDATDGKYFRGCTICLDIIYGVFAVVVPILIPYIQTYKETYVEFWGEKRNVGTWISMTAVVCSVLSTVVRTFEKAARTKAKAYLYDNEGNGIEKEMSLFLSKAGPTYKDCKDDTERFQNFVEQYNKVLDQNARSKLFKEDETHDISYQETDYSQMGKTSATGLKGTELAKPINFGSSSASEALIQPKQTA
eukprot:gnl/MRDRNA2_/MRDRNA2_82366_c0_seq7.p1 gnl/MRDRNA2_/MRDRNA2_82366_c0~~gnl/MRDRNA2_/MRDRNA2_82366_c0_seq7.p1  ORF type:complete len:271 (-),score=48.30 gnl/MRDRNA2_/MRDRNA2_82366_c0_seq7:434-1246(-)